MGRGIVDIEQEFSRKLEEARRRDKETDAN